MKMTKDENGVDLLPEPLQISHEDKESSSSAINSSNISDPHDIDNSCDTSLVLGYGQIKYPFLSI